MELNRDQIIQALECCIDLICDKPPTNDGDYNLLVYALSIIKAQKQEIQDISEENEKLRTALNTDISIVRLCRGSGKTQHMREVARVKMDAVRADTVRKMESRLLDEILTVARCQKADEPNIRSQEVFTIVKQITKELLEECD